MKRKATHDHRGKRIVEMDFIEGPGWCADLVRAETGELVLMQFRDGSAGIPSKATNALDCGSYVACPPDEDEITRHVRFPPGGRCSGYAPSANVLLDRIERFLSYCLDLDEHYRFLLACFVISTWVVDRLPVAPYIALVGLPQSGKSTALQALCSICRRGMITTDISSAAFYRACNRLTPTLCIDEAATVGQKRTLFHLLRSGTTRDALAFREGRSYRTYGAKVVAWTEMPDDEALNSRCITIPMQETTRTDLLRTTDSVVLDQAAALQANLQMYRMENYRTLDLAEIPVVERLRSRDRDLYEALALPIWEDFDACERLVECFANQQDHHREPLPPNQIAVLESLFKQIHVQPDQDAYTLRHLKNEVDQVLAASRERLRLNEKAISGVLKAHGFLNRKRTNAGWVVLIDRAARSRAHDLLSLTASIVHLTAFPLRHSANSVIFASPRTQ